jgi:hypothetical protein
MENSEKQGWIIFFFCFFSGSIVWFGFLGGAGNFGIFPPFLNFEVFRKMAPIFDSLKREIFDSLKREIFDRLKREILTV